MEISSQNIYDCLDRNDSPEHHTGRAGLNEVPQAAHSQVDPSLLVSGQLNQLTAKFWGVGGSLNAPWGEKTGFHSTL